MPEPTTAEILAINPELVAAPKKQTSLGWILFWLVGFTPVGCFFVWTKTTWSTPVKLVVIVVSLGLFLGLLLESELLSTQLLGSFGSF